MLIWIELGLVDGRIKPGEILRKTTGLSPATTALCCNLQSALFPAESYSPSLGWRLGDLIVSGYLTKMPSIAPQLWMYHGQLRCCQWQF